MTRASAAVLGLGLALTWLAPSVARAEGDVERCTVRIIHALEQGARADAAAAAPRIDPRIDKLRPHLSKPPFTAWQEFTLLEEKTLELKPKAPQTFQLPNGKAAQLAFVEHLPDQPGRPHRIRLQLQIGDAARPDMNTVFVVTEGGTVLQAGQRYKHGLLILGTSCEHPR